MTLLDSNILTWIKSHPRSLSLYFYKPFVIQLEYYVHFWLPHCRKNVEKVQMIFSRMLLGLECFSCTEKIVEAGFVVPGVEEARRGSDRSIQKNEGD